MNNDGTGLETRRATVTGATLSTPVTHFSVRGWAISHCGPNVTWAIGREACREMAEALAFATSQAEELDELTEPARIQLAADLITQFRIWLERFILPQFEEAADPGATGSSVDHLFFVALSEYDAIHAILQLTAQLDPAAALANELRTVDARIPQAFATRRRERPRRRRPRRRRGQPPARARTGPLAVARPAGSEAISTFELRRPASGRSGRPGL